ncbi:MAG: hypothetical protein E7226_02740 [Clostridiales bacterium]|nr:hypothetical protein [Clostridiales bacterium]
MGKRFKRISVVMIAHYISLTWRSALCVTLLIIWLGGIINGSESILYHFEEHGFLMGILWVLFMGEMIARFFPSGIRSPGCQKQFAHNFKKTGNTEIMVADNHATVLVVFAWILFNGFFGALHMVGVLNDDFMLLLCSLFSVGDMICILFFCPFQSWFFKNRCCVSCRIYNWDFAMMFTPLFFVPGLYTWSLLGVAIVLLVVWEIMFFLHPERFSENTNAFLSCDGCTEKLCRHKRQLRSLWKKNEQFFTKRIRLLKG